MRDQDPKVTFHPRGRLGNLMFQTAAAIGYAKKYNVAWGVPRRTPEVPRFHEFFPGLPICDNHFRSYQEHPNDDFCQVHNCNKGKCWFNYHDIPFHPQGVQLAGFWQSWRYFNHCQEEVQKAFRLKEYPELKDYVSIHVRRGDYVKYDYSFPPVTREYVSKALEHVPTANARGFLMFSDDIAWCKETWGDDIEYAGSNPDNPLENLAMMASCSHNIIANSTYSYWAAWLNKNPNKIVVSPSHKRGSWFGMQSGVQSDCIDLLPPNWTQIEFR